MKRTHKGAAVYTRRLRDLFRKRYWLRCIEDNCHEFMGPYNKITIAWDHSLEFGQRECPWYVISEQSLA